MPNGNGNRIFILRFVKFIQNTTENSSLFLLTKLFLQSSRLFALLRLYDNLNRIHNYHNTHRTNRAALTFSFLRFSLGAKNSFHIKHF